MSMSIIMEAVEKLVNLFMLVKVKVVGIKKLIKETIFGRI